jgi:hypothetical protein
MEGIRLEHLSDDSSLALSFNVCHSRRTPLAPLAIQPPHTADRHDARSNPGGTNRIVTTLT